MLDTYIKEHNISLYSIAKGANVPYSTLRGLSCGMIDVSRCQVGILKRIADYLDFRLDEVYELLKDGQNCMTVYGELNKTEGKIVIRDRAYYLESKYGTERICNANPDNAKAITTFAVWQLTKHEEDDNFERFADEVWKNEKDRKF